MVGAASEDLLRRLHPHVSGWFAARFPAPTQAQRLAWPRVLEGRDALLVSPTGSGKTLAAFLGILSRLHDRHDARLLEPRPYAVYVSPLKALAQDVARNLVDPLEGIQAHARARGGAPPELRVAIRTGDTPQAERDRQARAPPHILVTTPESLALLLVSPAWRAHLAGIEHVIVDEIHALAEGKRGAHLSLSLERLDALSQAAGAPPPARVGLSATVSPLPEVARFLGGARPVEALEAPPKEPPAIEVRLVPDDPLRASDEEAHAAMRDALVDLAQRHRSLLLFTNTRRDAEGWAAELDALLAPENPHEGASHDPAFPAPEVVPFAAPHHGSMSRAQRLVVEERLKRAELRCVVASSSLEMGIDMGSVDHVALLGSPKGVARALQRVGRAEHRVGGVSRATLLVDDAAEVAEALALVGLARRGVVEDVRITGPARDVLAQHILGLALEGGWRVEEAWRLARRSACYHALAREDFDAVVAHLTGGPKPLAWLAADVLAAGAWGRWVYARNAGAIPDAGRVRVVHGATFVGEVEEGFVEGLAPGDVFQLGGASWRFLGAQGLRARVEPAPGAAATVPGWRSEGLGTTPRLAAETGHLLQAIQRSARNVHAVLSERDIEGGLGPSKVDAILRNGNDVSKRILERLEELVALQARFSLLPAPDALSVESFVDGQGRRVHAVHAFLGRRIHETLARALAWRLQIRFDASCRPLAGDGGFVLLTPRSLRPSRAAWLRLLEAPLEDDLRRALAESELLRRRFRHVARRGLLLPRLDETPLARAQQEAGALLKRLQAETPDHPMLREAWDECLHDALDLEGAERCREAVVAGSLAWVTMPARSTPSPLGARLLARAEAPWARREIVRDAHEAARDWLDTDGA